MWKERTKEIREKQKGKKILKKTGKKDKKKRKGRRKRCRENKMTLVTCLPPRNTQQPIETAESK